MLPKEAKIMVVDDMKMIRTAIKKYLAELGYENTVEAANGREAVAKFSSEKPAMVFMDIVMPDMSGNEALNEIRKTDQATPIVMLTSVAEEGMVKECSSAGILGYILKPLNTDNGPGMLSSMLGKVG